MLAMLAYASVEERARSSAAWFVPSKASSAELDEHLRAAADSRRLMSARRSSASG
jgi:hypothetical protein